MPGIGLTEFQQQETNNQESRTKMETIKAINEWSFQLMFLVLSVGGMSWCAVVIAEAVSYAVRQWFKPAKRTGPNAANEARNTAKE